MSHEHIFPTHPLPEQQLHQHEDHIKRHAPTARQNAKQPAPPIVAKPCDPQAIPAVVNLFNNLMTIQKAGKTVFGHHDSFAYGISDGGWTYGVKNKQQMSDVFFALNESEYPGLNGWDIGGVETGSATAINDVKFSDMLDFIKDAYTYDHIITISWHCKNPVKGNFNEFAINGYGKEFNPIWDILNPKKDKDPRLDTNFIRNNYISYLNTIVTFFSDKRISNIPIIFRPFHESNMNRIFWWDENNGRTPEIFVKFWQFTIDYLQSKGIHNLLYCLSLNNSQNLAYYLKRYNPDSQIKAYFDIIGIDDYQKKYIYPKNPYYNSNSFKSRLQAECSAMQKIFPNKLRAVTETGASFLEYDNLKGQIINDNWFTDVLEPALKNTQICYVMLWRNSKQTENYLSVAKNDINKLESLAFYCSYKSHPSQNSFKLFFKNPKYIFHRALRNMKFSKTAISKQDVERNYK